MRKVFERPRSLRDVRLHYCPGCGHSTLHRIVAECVDRLDIRERTIAIAPVGCAVYAYDYFDFDVLEVPHGRPPAAATGIKRSLPDRLVISYQGDGDLAAIGTGEIIHAANRGENITVFFVNNAIYGMTGGQMAPTTLMGQKTTTTPAGRDIGAGYPLKVAELLAGLEGAAFIARTSLDSPKNVLLTERLFEKALRYQMESKGFSLVEVLSPCPTDWKLTPEESLRWMAGPMKDFFPLGIFKDRHAGAKGPSGA
ncbi:MAG: thiamine pyrophosphate-dependent enzyme [Nitrospiraceae bacterium]|nr:thiamine pyrophosphate-dependent enzyme [Nitrospiraceae bacterium]